MANQEHLDTLRQDVEIWNRWRTEYPDIKPDLRESNLRESNLINADLSGAELRDADLIDADLGGANLYGVNLYGAHLHGANLGKVQMGATIFGENDLSTVRHHPQSRWLDERGRLKDGHG